jgi:hypothetical protein
MSDFFEPAPAPPAPEPERFRPPPWFGPPDGTLPGVVALELILARTDAVAVCITRLSAYPTGFEFDLLTMTAADADDELLDPMLFGHRRHRAHRGLAGIPPEMLRVGVQFADGGKATNTSGFHRPDDDPPAGPVMLGGGGGGGGGRWRQTEWVWPLPPPGPVTFVCEWPAAGIPLTRHDLDAQTILDAAARATVIFSEEHLPVRPSATAVTGPAQAVVRHPPS